MKKNLLYILAIIFLASCSTPKYSYYFDRYDYHAGKKKAAERVIDEREAKVLDDLMIKEPLLLEEETLMASTSDELVVDKKATVEAATRTYKEMSRSERKAFRKEAKQLIKSYIKAKKAGDEVKAAEAAKAMDHDLKLAAIFGAVGIVSLLIGGDVFWILGAIALIIGAVFFVLWLSRQ